MMGFLAVSVMSQAHAVALSARVGALDAQQVSQLAFISDRLDADHPLRVAALSFCARHAGLRHDRVALADAGADLQRAVLRAVRPAPVDQNRSDIHG